VENKIGEPSLIHWHGLTPPWQQDGPRRIGPPIGGRKCRLHFRCFGGTF
jgi:FtsP/CotA-like multicopper oxidase with cupredoxin domain